MTTNVNVTVGANGSPVQVVGSYGDSFQVANTGSNEIWLGGDSSVSLSSGVPLLPGGSIPWNAGAALWAVAAPGKPSVATALFNADGTYSPGQTNVVATNPNAPQIIPALSASGAVGTALQTTNIINTPNTPNSGVDVSAYESLIFVVHTTAGPVGTNNPADYLNLVVEQADQNNFFGSPLLTDRQQAQWLAGTNGGLDVYRLQVPVRGQYAALLLQAIIGAAGSTAGTVTVTTYGSQESCPSPRYINRSGFGSTTLSGKPSGVSVTVQGTQAATPMESTNDPGYLQVRGNSGTTTGTAFLQQADSGNLVVIAEATLLANALSSDTPFIAPMRPLYLTTNQTVASLSTAVNQ